MVDKKDNVVDFKTHLKKRQKEQEVQEVESEPLSIVESNEDKYLLFSQWIDEGMVMVTLNSSLLGVRVPEQIRGLIQLNLNFSHNFYLDDFEYDRRGVRASLSFSGVSSFCEIPWPAVWSMRSDALSSVAISPKSVPLELRDVVIGDQAIFSEEKDSVLGTSDKTEKESEVIAFIDSSKNKIAPKQGELFAAIDDDSDLLAEIIPELSEDSIAPASASSHLHLVE